MKKIKTKSPFTNQESGIEYLVLKTPKLQTIFYTQPKLRCYNFGLNDINGKVIQW